MMKKILPKVLIVAVILILAATAGYFYWQNQKNSGQADAKEAQQLANRISKFMLLPSETPTLATVTDKTKLSGQRFFVNAENGDKVLIFPLASEAILFRPSINKIIQVAAVQMNNGNSAAAVPTMVVPQGPVTVSIYNGTPTVGLAAKIEKLLKPDGVTVTDRETATSTDYQQTVVLDISGHNAAKLQQMADTLGAKIITQLPAGESKPNSDILVIIGKDKQ